MEPYDPPSDPKREAQDYMTIEIHLPTLWEDLSPLGLALKLAGMGESSALRALLPAVSTVQSGRVTRA
jgi:hypothetical protein